MPTAARWPMSLSFDAIVVTAAAKYVPTGGPACSTSAARWCCRWRAGESEHQPSGRDHAHRTGCRSSSKGYALCRCFPGRLWPRMTNSCRRMIRRPDSSRAACWRAALPPSRRRRSSTHAVRRSRIARAARAAARACPRPRRRPVGARPEKDWRPELYTVKRGDTLYAIALEHGLDYRELAALNNIDNLNVIRIGQVLQLRRQGRRCRAPAPDRTAGFGSSGDRCAAGGAGDAGGAARRPTPGERGNTETYKVQPKAIKVPYSEPHWRNCGIGVGRNPAGNRRARWLRQSRARPGAAAVSDVAPSAVPGPGRRTTTMCRLGLAGPGQDLSAYSETASLKGIDIGGTAGAPIIASAPGRVVYAGSGLRGYGKLVIVKHNKTYLSAYAHSTRSRFGKARTSPRARNWARWAAATPTR